MIQFNPDGSLKVPGHIQEAKNKEKNMWLNSKCIKIRKEVLMGTPKKCLLHLELSAKWDRNDFVEYLSKFSKGETPIKLKKENDRYFTIEIGSSFRRCSECNQLTGRYRQHSNGFFILEKGTCTYEPRQMHYEDYFD